MRSWPASDVPSLPDAGLPAAARPLRLHDTGTGTVRPAGPAAPGGTARMYVCGITPYDATHIGHANTYVAFDLVNRVWRDNGLRVHYVQNTTDVDDPLLERARETGEDWPGAGRTRDPAVPRGHDRPAGPAARALHRRGRVDPPHHRDDREAARPGRRLRGRRRRVLPGLRRPRLRAGERAVPRGDAAAVRRARRRPGPPRQEATPSTRCCGRRGAPASRTGTPRSARAARAGTWSAPRSPSSTSAWPSTSRAAARTWRSRTTR